MAVTDVQELFPQRFGGDDLSRRREYTRTFEVRTDDVDDDAYTAGAGTGIPRNGEPHPSDADAIMVRIRANQYAEDSTLWLVECEYSSDIPEEQGREALNYDVTGLPVENPNSSTGGSGGGGSGSQIEREVDPRSRPPVWVTDWEQTTELFTHDINGDEVVNSADRPFDPPHTIERSLPVITITKNVATDSEVLNLSKQQDWQEITNSDTPWGFAAKTLRFARFHSHSAVENGIAYAEVSVTLRVKWNTWVLKFVDAGFVDIAGRRIGRDPVTGTYSSEPVLLDGSGFELPVGDSKQSIPWEAYRPEAFIPILALLGVTA